MRIDWKRLGAIVETPAERSARCVKVRADAITALGMKPEDEANRYAASTGELVQWQKERMPNE